MAPHPREDPSPSFRRPFPSWALTRPWPRPEASHLERPALRSGTSQARLSITGSPVSWASPGGRGSPQWPWQRLKGSVAGETEVPPEQQDLKGSERVKPKTTVCWTPGGLEATPRFPLEENQAGVPLPLGHTSHSAGILAQHLPVPGAALVLRPR